MEYVNSNTGIIGTNCVYLITVYLFIPGPVPRDQGVLKVLEYLANHIDFESCVSQALEYLLELSKTEEGLYLDPKGKKLVAMAMKNNMTDVNVQVAGCYVLNSLVIAGLYVQVIVEW